MRPLLRRFAILLGSALAALVLFELLLRLIDPFHTGEVIEREAFELAILEPHPSRPQSILRAGAEAKFLGDTYSINDLRMRGPRLPFEKPDGVYRIVVAGDSIAFGWGVTEQDCFPRILERRLNEAPKPDGVERYEVINGGTPGWGIPSYYVYLQETGLRFAPDLVVITIINNDLTDIIKSVQGSAAESDLLTLPSWSQWSYIARAVQNVHALATAAQGDLVLTLKANPEVTNPACDLACDAVNQIRELCGDTPVVVLDTLGDIDGKPLPRLADGLEQRGIDRIEAFLPLRNYAEEFAITAIDVHPNARGHRMYADWLFEWMRR